MNYLQRRAARIGVATLLAVVGAVFASNARADEKAMKEITARAQAIAPTLATGTYGAKLIAPEHWAKLAELPIGKSLVKTADAMLKESDPALPEDLYKEYYKNGNRSNYEGTRGKLVSRINHFALAEIFVGDGRYLDALNTSILYLCDQPSWVLPAHDRDAIIYDGKDVYSDLGSTAIGGDLAIAINALADKLPEATVARARAEIERRILQPYRDSVKVKQNKGMWWITTTNNWSAVCHAGTVAAALNAIDSPEDRAFFLAAADYFSENYFMNGFTNDGYCSEGMGYWDYGVGNFIQLGALCREATQGKLNLFRYPKMHAVLDYAPTLEITRGNYAVFSDCSMTARPSARYVGYLSRVIKGGYADFEVRGLGRNIHFSRMVEAVAFGGDEEITFDPELLALQDSKDANAVPKLTLPIRTEFADAGVVICRPDPSVKKRYFATAFKAGNNNEMHNHNDVGSYTLIMGDASDPKAGVFFPSRDPGGEKYTKRTFSSQRYVGELLNSFGHPVPKIAGQLQSTGAKARGVVFEKSFSDEKDVFAEDFTSAYPVETLAKATRRFEYGRARGDDQGYFQIEDYVAFKDGAKETVETAIITFEKFELEENGDGIRVKYANAACDVNAKDKDGNALKLIAETTIVGENDPSVGRKPTRIAFKFAEPIAEGTITQRFTAN